VLPLGLFLSPIGGRRLFNQARELCFCCVLGSACNHKLTLEEGDPLNCLISFYASRSQQGGLSWATLLATSGDRPSPSHLLSKPESPPPEDLSHQLHPRPSDAQKSQEREEVRKPRKGQRNPGKDPPFHLRTNPEWLQNIPTHRGQCVLQQSSRRRNLRACSSTPTSSRL
jgi:hypothetical protein